MRDNCWRRKDSLLARALELMARLPRRWLLVEGRRKEKKEELEVGRKGSGLRGLPELANLVSRHQTH